MTPAWTFSSAGAGGGGDFTGTPIVANGCVYAGSNAGWVFAINADSGALVWKTQLDAPQGGLFAGGGVPGTLVAADGRIYAMASRNPEPFLAALDQSTGEVLWETVVSTRPGATLYASPVVFDGLVFVGVSAPTAAGSGHIVLVDATSGAIVTDTVTIPEELWDQGFQGARRVGDAGDRLSLQAGICGDGRPEGRRRADRSRARERRRDVEG